ncbi:hypothetical protein [Modestobacter sp. NPDC049651]|uniref:hypothetical protein n=1 Tax=unclassified Modestobacter TaxID=2643866 RepID=UPI0033F18A87
MANLIGLERRQGDVQDPDARRWTGPLHAVAPGSGAAARAAASPVRALCGAEVEVVDVQDVPDDAGLCRACQYGD